MKKFYAILASAMVVAGVNAAPVQNVSKAVKVGESLQLTENLVKGDKEMLKDMLTPVVKVLPETRIKKSRSQEEPLYPLNGNLLGENLVGYQTQKDGTWYPYISYCTIAEDADSLVVNDFVYNFIDAETLPVPASVEYYEFDDPEEGTYGGWVLTIPAGYYLDDEGAPTDEAKTQILDVDGKPWDLFVYAQKPKDDKMVYYSNCDVQYLIREDGSMFGVIVLENGIFVMTGSDKIGMGIAAIERNGDYWMPRAAVEPMCCNATQTGLDYDFDNQEYVEMDPFPVWTNQFKNVTEDGNEVNALFVFGMQETPGMFYFIIDPETNHGWAEDQALINWPDYGDFLLGCDFEHASEFILECELSENEEGNTVVTILGSGEYNEWLAYCPGVGSWTIGAETVFTLNYNFWTGSDTQGNASIKDVEMGNDNTAPVYYNLQGMQVANPQAGQIYIVKQGNKVSKQIIR